MKNRLLLLTIIASAAAAGCSIGDVTGTGNGGILPDTLPLTVSDSVVTFSVARSAIYVGDTISVFFTVKNVRTDTLRLQGSGSCTFTVRAYNSAGTRVSPPAQRACTADLAMWATLAPGATYARSVVWTATDGLQFDPGPKALPAGVYDLEAYIEANGFTATGRRLKFQIFNR